MVEKVLEAYEEEVVQNKPPIIKRLNFGGKCIIFVYITGTIILFLLTIIFQTFYVFLFYIIYCYAGQYAATALLEKIRHKKWKSNIKEYNDELDEIAKILKREDFNLYDKMKLKQLIRKYYQEIGQNNLKIVGKNNEAKNFIFTYITPIIAFFAGNINNIFFSSNIEWIAMGIVVISVIVVMRYVYTAFKEMAGMISWNVLEKEQAFVPKLQDLLDRDFVIESEDLIPIK